MNFLPLCGEASSVSKQTQQPQLGFSQGSLRDSQVSVAVWGLPPKSGWWFSPLLMWLGLSYCLFMAPQWICWPKLCCRLLVLDAQAYFSLLVSCLMPRFCLTLSFVIYLYLLVMTPGPSCWPCPSSVFSCLVWFQPDLIMILATPSQTYLMLGQASGQDLFALHIGTVLYQCRVLGCLGHDTLVCFSGDCVSWCQLWLQSPALGFFMSSCPGFICPLPR